MASTGRFKWHAIAGLILGVALLNVELPMSFAFDRPLLSSIVALLSCALVLLVWAFLSSSRHERDSKGGQQRRQSFSHGIGQQGTARHGSSHVLLIGRGPLRIALSRERLRILGMSVVLYVRIEILRQVLVHVQCAGATKQPLLALLAISEYKRRQSAERQSQRKTWSLPGSYRQLSSVLMVSIGGLIVLATARNPRSSYICAATEPYRWLVPCLQWIGLTLDFAIGYYIIGMLREDQSQSAQGPAFSLRKIAAVLSTVAGILAVPGVIYFWTIALSSERKEVLEVPLVYFGSLAKLVALICIILVSCITLASQVGVGPILILSTFTAAVCAATAHVWNLQLAWALPFSSVSFAATGIVILGFALYISADETFDAPQTNERVCATRPRPWLYIALIILFVVYAFHWSSSTGGAAFHFNHYLIADAKNRHEAYEYQASRSQTLTEASQAYRERYGQHPPPGFDHWYEYARARNSVIIDDYDSIYDDLLPFYSLSPAEIRDRSWKMISNPWHDAAGIIIRNGTQEISKFIPPTHRWMLEGVLNMIRPFEKWLPDMDLAFNINDECRVTVPYETLQPMLENGRQWQDVTKKPNPDFDPDRAQTWKPIPEKAYEEKLLDPRYAQRIFQSYAAVSCPPSSPARTKRHWDTGRLCLSCAAPHSIGPFLANWTLASDICHQPDLADLHGLYLSPGAFKGTHELYPIFSQSKASGFNDILYPSAWNYNDKVRYNPGNDTDRPEDIDPEFTSKTSSLFWRGSASEGMSSGRGQWSGMSRQRFTHLHFDEAYQPLPIEAPSHSAPRVAMDVHFTDIARCGEGDCEIQKVEYAPLADRVTFQGHWKYSHLLDLDGAGFSGRFLPFLQSRSVVFKASLVKEWWHARLTAWRHFVPVDLRGWGLKATMAALQDKEAEEIALAGRDWVEKALRKEDMEIYLFRLLLEWGRLTDDRREELGFDG